MIDTLYLLFWPVAVAAAFGLSIKDMIRQPVAMPPREFVTAADVALAVKPQQLRAANKQTPFMTLRTAARMDLEALELQQREMERQRQDFIANVRPKIGYWR